ncbi:MAG TPA: NHLP bacteriocin export ABC transporter permease/ATPase subunit, partial [Oscillatoriaceae cyanobacterium]
GLLVDNAIPDSDRTLLLEMGMGLMMTAVGKAVFTICQGVLLQRVEARADASTQAGVWDRVLNLGAPFFRRYEIGDLCSRVMAISAIRQSLSGQVLGSALSSLFALLNLALMLTYNVQLTLVAVAITLLSVGATAALSVVRIRRAQPLRELEGTLQGTVIQLINGVAKLRTAGAEGRAFAHWGGYFQRRTELRRRLQDLDNVMSLINQALPLVSSIAIFFVAATSLGLEVEGNPGGLSTGVFLAFNAAAGTFMGGIAQLAGVLVSQLNLSISWQRALPILQEPPEVSAEQLDPGRLTGRIAFEHVTFRYEPDSRPILDDVSLTIEPGEHVALVGPSGCGKSTIFRLLLGFETPEAGIVAYDHQDLRTLDPRAVRRQLGVVLQSGRLASGSVFDNVTAGALLSQEEVWEAIRGAGMEADIRRMPMGLHTVVSEGGSNLSGGQRQRLLIARALAQRPRIVFFDEATSALDNETQAIVSATLDRLRATRVVIAHRLSTIRQADKIVVMEAGRVVQMGTFDQLAREEGLFARLVERQSV